MTNNPPLLRLLTCTILATALPALRAADFPSIAVPNTSAGNTLELRNNGILIGKSPSGNPAPASLLATDEGRSGILWHPFKQAFAAGYIPSEPCIGFGSVSFGWAMASGTGAFAAGLGDAGASGNGSVAIGSCAWATGAEAVALGYGFSSGGLAFAANGGAAVGIYSAAFNMGTSNGYMASAFGLGTVAQGRNQTVVGMYNLAQGDSSQVWNGAPAPTDALFIVGNGTLVAQGANWVPVSSNAFTVASNGNTAIQGALTVQGLNRGSSTPVASAFGSDVNVHGTVRVRPAGDLSMGSFQSGTQP